MAHYFPETELLTSQSLTESIPLNFGRMNVAVAFTNEQDIAHFTRIPRAYFDAVRRREPREVRYPDLAFPLWGQLSV